MQTFITDHDMKQNAQNLDYRRLGKQRIEAITIARILLGLSSNNSWANHPAVKMWEGYESFLVRDYLYEIMKEWKARGYKNTKCEEHYGQLLPLVPNYNYKPYWITNDFIEAHKSNLIRKNPEYYQDKFPGIPDDLPYIWPV